ncbi:MAG: MG2 domain-containing protein [Desulfuromonadales bacterium]
MNDAKKPGMRIDRWLRGGFFAGIVLLTLLGCLVPADRGWAQGAGLLRVVDVPAGSGQKKTAPAQGQTFTITAIEPDLRNRNVHVTFSHPCNLGIVRNALKVFPPAQMNWYNSGASGNTIRISGDFEPGRQYTIFLPEQTACANRTYAPTLTTFRIPDLDPAIRYAEQGSVIERDSREMLHAGVVNIEELEFVGLQIPPLLVPAALEAVRGGGNFAGQQARLEEKQREFIRLAGAYEELRPFLYKVREDRQLFFPGGAANREHEFSLPLSFRQQPERGAVELVALRGRGLERTVESAARLLRITDLALTYKISADGLLVWATSLHSGQPLAGVKLLAFAADAHAVPLGRTGTDGLLLARAGEEKLHLPLAQSAKATTAPLAIKDIRLLVAAGEGDTTYLEIAPRGNLKPDWLPQPAKKSGDRLLKGHLFTERGIYRPGDTVHFKGTLRQFAKGEITPPPGIDPVFVLFNAKGEQVFEKKLTLSEFGTAADSFTLKPFFPLGAYTLEMRFGADDKVSRTFQVQEFRPPRHFTEIRFEPLRRKDPSYVNLDREVDLLQCEIAGKYYAGGPVKHGKVRWKVYATGTGFPHSDFPTFKFGNYLESRHRLLESGESMLDEKGNLTVTLPLGKDVAAGLYGVEMIATVVDFDGRAAAQTAVYQKKPDFLVGIGVHPEQVESGDPQVLNLLVLNRKGGRVTAGALAVEVLRKGYIYIKKRNDNGDVYWSWEEAWNRQYASSLALAAAAIPFEFDFAWGGEYLLKFTYQDRDGAAYTSSTRYRVAGDYYGYEYENRSRGFEKLSMIPERTELAPGDTLRLYLHPHRQLARVLLSIERDRIIEHRVVEIAPGQKYIDLPMRPEYVPNVYISLLGTVARGEFPVHTGEFDDQAPTFLFGAVNIEVKEAVNHLKVAINQGEATLKAEPGAQVTVRLDVTDRQGQGVASEVALAVVDESVLALTGFATPKLDDITRFLGPLAVFTGDLRSELLKQTPYGWIRNEAHSGGDGMEKSPDAPTTKVRKDFRPVAYFHPSLRTDAAGRAEATFTVPDTMTTYRVYAVAGDRGSQFASEERELLAVKDFYLEPGLPRFFTRGDVFRFAIGAFNKTAQGGEGTLTLTDDPALRLQAAAAFDLQGYDRALLPVQGQALKAQTASLGFAGRFGDREDKVEIQLPVHSGRLIWEDNVFGAVKRSGSVRYNFPAGTEKISWSELNPDEVQVLLTVSGSPFLRLGEGLRYLLRYPYGCVEQISSGVLPLAGLRGLIRDGLLPGFDIEQTDKFLRSGIDSLFTMQTEEGGFGYWPGHRRPHLWGSVYATTAITLANRAGMDVPAERLGKAVHYLKEALGGEGKNDPTFKGFAAYLLALNGALDEPRFREMYGQIKDYPRQSALLLLMAGKISGLLPPSALPGLTRAALDRQWQWLEEDAFRSRYREPAIALLAATTLLPADDAVAGRLAQQLLRGVNQQGIWSSTSDTGWSLVALGEYFRGKSFAADGATVRLRAAGQPEMTATVGANEAHTFALDPRAFLASPQFTLATGQDRDLLYQLSLKFPRVDYAATGYQNGFRLHKTIENTDGGKVIRIGDVVKVTLNIDIEGNDFRYLVLDDPLPAGLVAINSALKTEEAVGKGGNGEDDQDAWHWSDWDAEGRFYRFVPNFFEIRDDRVLAFKDRAWHGNYRYSYYARAVCEGEFVLPASKIQLMYEPATVSYTPVDKVIIEGR